MNCLSISLIEKVFLLRLKNVTNLWLVSSVDRAGVGYSSTPKVQGSNLTCDGYPACLPPHVFLPFIGQLSYPVKAEMPPQKKDLTNLTFVENITFNNRLFQ